ncbi:MAG: hypothetical protein ABI768_07740 [Acidobacteriota bacterium]
MRSIRFAALCLAAAPLLVAHPPLAAAPRQPDLRVAVQLAKVQRNGKWFVNMRFTVHNAGLVPAPQSVLGAWCRAVNGGPCPGIVPKPEYKLGPPAVGAGSPVVELRTPMIGAGGSAFVLGPQWMEWPNGGYTITARADFPNHIPESNEANNEATAAIVIP